jgi:Ca2+-binding RTX toxin-like protein
MSVAPQILEAVDDVSPQTGEVQYGEYTNDTSPVIRVSLGDQAAAGEQLLLSDNGAAVGSGVTITAAMLSQGYADVPLANLGDGWNLLTATIKAPDGTVVASSMPFALGVATTPPSAPAITGADNGAGTTIADGGHTTDPTPVFHFHEDGLPAPPTSSPGHAPYGGPAILDGHIELFDGSQMVGQAMIGFGGDVTLTTSTLAPGEHTLVAEAVDRAGNVSATSAPFTIFIDGAAGQADPAAGGSLLQAGPGNLQIEGGVGADTIVGADQADVLHGGAGSDSILGGAQFNNINGNSGDDTIVGRSHVGDWLLGGQGNDSIDATQSSGHNVLNGNLGADTLLAGTGGDTLRGGQGDDVLTGGSGADWLSGDMGHNTLTGGAGADTFHAGNGTDLITDFNHSQGDVILLDHGAHWTASQVGADTVVTLNGGGQMTLAGVNLSSLSSGWIVQA